MAFSLFPRGPLVALVFFIALSLTYPAHAATDYVIKKGDTPKSIAKKHGVSVDAILKANTIVPKNMKIGTVIKVPAKGEAAGKKQKTASAGKKRGAKVASAKTMEKTPEAATVKVTKASRENPYHTVKKGDTLLSISKKYEIGLSELKDLNNLKSRKLKTGQKVLVRHIGPKTYIVKKGDTMKKIARKFDMDAEDLMVLNELESQDLHAGQKLYLEDRLDESSAEHIQQVMGRNVEEEIKKVAETEEFAEKSTNDKLITFAKKMINIPYKFGGTSILGIDCSAYVKKVYGLLGVNLPRTAREQFKEGETIDRDELLIGDLVFFRTYASFPSHVGIYLGNNLFIHASSKGRRVTIDSLETPYYLKRFIGGKRLITETEQEADPKG
ncbi:MAG: LysM peptidoglycan-binding domain-containing protein [Nitrospirae bacterium]|nr:LysM peptidoglycan-binding domain-containing protein [Nitrospirota bacterium]